MRGVFDDEEQERADRQPDTEVTLGLGMFLLLLFGLVMLCVLCFGLGYEVGHRGSQPNMAAAQPSAGGAGTPLQTNGSLAKPPATMQPAAAPTEPPPVPHAAPQGDGAQHAIKAPPQAVAAPIAANPAPTPAIASRPDATSTPAKVSSPAKLPPAQPQVHPALPSAVTAPPAISASNVHPAVPSSPVLMVQIAAVSHQEDADVLTGALRKRGYAVNARRDPKTI